MSAAGAATELVPSARLPARAGHPPPLSLPANQCQCLLRASLPPMFVVPALVVVVVVAADVVSVLVVFVIVASAVLVDSLFDVLVVVAAVVVYVLVVFVIVASAVLVDSVFDVLVVVVVVAAVVAAAGDDADTHSLYFYCDVGKLLCHILAIVLPYFCNQLFY